MSDLIGNPKDRFSHYEAHVNQMHMCHKTKKIMEDHNVISC